MTFFDQANFISQFKVMRKVNDYTKQNEFYQEQLVQIKKESKEVLGSKDALETFAREKYYLKEEGETVFVLIDENGNPIE